ncbi:MAG TPA: response regulator transcription factor [Candidatus Sulfotelmatobacter sp.]|nr:response regulator transcription factor [Candidatus Sulfotelmatobacter sp.]
MRILVVEDHAPTRGLLKRSLEDAGMDAECVSRCSTALQRASQVSFDVIVLDLMLPDGDGLELCRSLRATGVTTPVLCLSARADVEDRVKGLDAGADDYLKKPFALAELHARLRALGRRAGTAPPRRVAAQATRIDFATRRLEQNGGEVPLTAREWAVLEALIARDGRVVERVELLELIWHGAGPTQSASLDVILSRLRRKLGGPGSGIGIRTLRGAGLAIEIRP